MNGVAATLYLPEFTSVSTSPAIMGTRSSDSEGYREPSCSCCQTGCDTGCHASETQARALGIQALKSSAFAIEIRGVLPGSRLQRVP